MTRTRAFHRFHRWTARLRRRHLRAWLPGPRETDPITPCRGADLRQRARIHAELDTSDCLGDGNRVLEQQLL
jgi:hypothetical protein